MVDPCLSLSLRGVGLPRFGHDHSGVQEVTTTTPPNCTECGEPCITGCIKRRDAADEQHDFHVDCYITMLWWLGGHHDDPSENDPEWVEYRRKMRAAIAHREAASQKAAT